MNQRFFANELLEYRRANKARKLVLLNWTINLIYVIKFYMKNL